MYAYGISRRRKNKWLMLFGNSEPDMLFLNLPEEHIQQANMAIAMDSGNSRRGLGKPK